MAEAAFGVQLRQFRQAADLSLRQLAARVDYDHSYLSQVERGLRPGSTHLAQLCDRALGTSPALTVAYVQTIQPKEPARRMEPPVLRPGADGVGGLEQVRRGADGVGGLEQVRRGLAGSFGMQSRESEEWRAIAAAYAGEFATTPPGELLPELAADLQLLHASSSGLASSDDSADSRELSVAAAELSLLTALTLAGQGRVRTAARWWRTARLAADSSGEKDVGSLVRGWEVRSGVAERRSLDELLGTAEEGFGLAEEPGQLARVLAGRAEVLAALGDAVGAQRAVRGLLVVGDELPVGSGSVFTCCQREVFGVAGGVWAALGETEAAYEALERALGLCPAELVLERAGLELVVARCLVLDGDVAAGLAVAMRVLVELPDQWHTHPLYEVAGRVQSAVRGKEVGWEYQELLRRRPFENRSVGSGSRSVGAEG